MIRARFRPALPDLASAPVRFLVRFPVRFPVHCRVHCLIDCLVRAAEEGVAAVRRTASPRR